MNKPVATFKKRGMAISVWERQTGYSYTYQKRYQDKQSGEWKESKSLFPNELDDLLEIVTAAIAFRDGRKAVPDEGRESVEVLGVKIAPKVNTFDDDDIPF